MFPMSLLEERITWDDYVKRRKWSAEHALKFTTPSSGCSATNTRNFLMAWRTLASVAGTKPLRAQSSSGMSWYVQPLMDGLESYGVRFTAAPPF